MIVRLLFVEEIVLYWLCIVIFFICVYFSLYFKSLVHNFNFFFGNSIVSFCYYYFYLKDMLDHEVINVLHFNVLCFHGQTDSTF